MAPSCKQENDMTDPNNDVRELTIDDLEQVAGGMKTDPNYTSKDTIDARGGQITIGGIFPIVISFDVNGKVSGVSKAPA